MSVTKMESQALAALPYWEYMWNTLAKNGWHISHYAQLDEASGLNRHLIKARRSGDQLQCSAPTVTQAMQVVYAEAAGLD